MTGKRDKEKMTNDQKPSNLKKIMLIAGVIVAVGVITYFLYNAYDNPLKPQPTFEPNTTTTEEIRPVTNLGKTYGNYTETTELFCLNGSKPIVRLFGTTWCSHCEWEKLVLGAAVGDFNKTVDLRAYEIDKERPPEEELKLIQKYEGRNKNFDVPLIIIGCKYYRTNDNNQLGGAEAELKVVQQLVCLSFGNNAPSFCPKPVD